MKTEKYEKPSMRFVDIRNQQNIAKNCWHMDANGEVTEWYYDYDNPETPGGDGWVKFTMGTNCDATLGVVKEWYNVPEEEKGKIQDDLQSKLSKMEYDPSIVSPEPPVGWS